MTSLADLWQIFLSDGTAIKNGSASSANTGASTQASKKEDTTHTSGDIGDFLLGVHNAVTPTATTDSALDYSPMTVDAEGKQVVSPYAPTDYYWQTIPFTKTDTTDAVVKTSAGAGIRNYLTDATFSNTSAGAVLVNIKDGATVIHQVLVPAGGTVSESFAVPLKGTANTAINIAAATAITSLIINAQGYVGI